MKNQKGIDNFLLGIAEATNALVSLNLEEGTAIALKTLCDNLEVTSTGLYKTFKDSNGALVASLMSFSSQASKPERFANNQKISFTEFGQLYQLLLSGKPFIITYSNATGLLKNHMAADGTKAVGLFPILVEQELWGALSLSNMEKENIWTESETKLLLSLANSIGAAVERENLEMGLEEKVKQRTAELEDSKLRFQLAVEGTQNGIWDWEPQSDKIFWSEKMYANLGYEQGELSDLIDGFYDLIHPDEREEARRRFDDYLNNRVPYIMEFRLLKKNGDYHWFKATCKAVWDEHGRPLRVVGSHAEIHERKIYSQQLAEQEERFRAVVRDDPNALFLINQQDEILLHSNKSIEVFGYSHAELKGMKLEELLPLDKRKEYTDFMKSFFEKPYTYSPERDLNLKGRRKDDHLFFIDVGLSPVSLEGETLVMAIVTDITEQKEAEVKLQQSYRQINNLISNMPGIVYQCRNDLHWTMDYISPACEQITGFKQAEFYGSPSDVRYGELIVPEERDEIWNQVQESVSRKAPFRVTYRIKAKDGTQKWMWEQGVGVFDAEGKNIGLEGCVFDISPIIRNQERLSQAIYAAENRERARIASDLHDSVQQILGASSLNLKNIEEEVKKLSKSAQEHYRKSLQYLQQGIQESRNIAHQIMPYEVDQLGLNQAIQQLLDELKENLGIEISYYDNLREKPSKEIELSFYRIIQEAFNNISKYSKATKVSVQLISNENEFQMMIEDNGVGFDKNKIDLYRQGFGLTVMKNRIVALSGQLTVDSRPGRGTCLVVWLPREAGAHE